MVEEHTWLRKSSWNEKDEYYTPIVLVDPILIYISLESTIWCPTDNEVSEFVIFLIQNVYCVI